MTAERKLRISEVYLSTQGEGPRVGRPTVFVRFAGCNLRCPGWPCDTPHAIFPEKYRHEWELLTPLELANRVDEVTDYNRNPTICYTGGEPTLQNFAALEELTDRLENRGYDTFEMFSNGTIVYPVWLVQDVMLIMDWKLPGSGEDPYNPNRLRNLKLLREGDSVKFVIKDRLDFDIAVSLWREYLDPSPLIRTYAGVVWGKLETSELVDWVLERQLPWWINVQVHQHIWPANERRR